MKENKCPNCGKITDMATSTDGRDMNPSSGDISICIGCSTINQFDDDLTIIQMPIERINYIRRFEPEVYEDICNAVKSIKYYNENLK